MSGLLVLGLVATVLTGVAGDTVNATVLVYSPNSTTITINDQPVAIRGGVTQQVSVALPVEKGEHQQQISVTSDSMTYVLPVTVIGAADYSWVWWLFTVPAACLLYAIRWRRRVARS